MDISCLENDNMELDLSSLKLYMNVNDYEEQDDDVNDDDSDDNSDYYQVENENVENMLSSNSNRQANEQSSMLKQGDKSILVEITLESCLITNQMYQEALNDMINELEAALAANKEKQSLLQETLNGKKSDSNKIAPRGVKQRHWTIMTAPYFRDSNGYPSPLNEDAIAKRNNKELPNYLQLPAIWTKTEKVKLIQSIRANTKKQLMEPIMEKKEEFYNKLSVTKNKQDREDLVKLIENASSQIKNIQKMDEKVLVCSNTRELDWLSISNNDMSGRRSAESCELMWKNALHPSISKKHWTEQEDSVLKKLAIEHNYRMWNVIAEKLGSGRSEVQCLQRYSSYLQPNYLYGTWTEEENDKLLNVIEMEKIGDVIPWQKVYNYFLDRPPNLIRQHYTSTLADKEKSGGFSIEEDLIILLGVKKYGLDFIKIGQLIPGRNTVQIGDRYRNFMRKRLPRAFDIEDDQKMVKLYKQYGADWTTIASKMTDRKDYEVKTRFIRLRSVIPNILSKSDDPNFVFPFINDTKTCASLRRTLEIRQYVISRLDQLRKGKNAKFRVRGNVIRPRLSIKGPNKTNGVIEDQNQHCIIPDTTEDELDFLINEAQVIWRRWFERSETFVPKPKQKYSKAEQLIDKSLDELLKPTILAKSSIKHRVAKYSGKNEMQYTLSKSFIFKALNVAMPGEESVVQPKEVQAKIVQEDFNMDLEMEVEHHGNEFQYDSGENSESNQNPEKRTKFVNEYEVGKATIVQSCLSLNSERQLLRSNGILPPNRATVLGFKLMIMDRHRLADSAKDIIDEQTISLITGETKGDFLCFSCRRKKYIQDDFMGFTSSNTLAKSTKTYGGYRNSLKEFSKSTNSIISSATEQIKLNSMQNTQSINNSFISDIRNQAESSQTSNRLVDTVISQSNVVQKPTSLIKSAESLSNTIASVFIGDENSECKTCLCIKEAHNRYKLLESRFQSLFFWPGLLSTAKPPEGEIEQHPSVMTPKITKQERREKRVNEIEAKKRKFGEVEAQPETEVTPKHETQKEFRARTQQKRIFRYVAKNEAGEVVPTRRSARNAKVPSN